MIKKDFNALIDHDPCLISQWKTNKKYMKNLLNYQEMMTMQQKIYRLFVSSKPKLIGSDLRQRNTSIPQQINFWGKLKDDDGAAMF